MQEGQIWEALMTAYSKKIYNLVVMIDKNGYQLDGSTKDIKMEIPNYTLATLRF